MRTLRETRLARLISIEDLAKQTGVSTKTIVETELGRTRPKLKTMRTLSQALGVDPLGIEEVRAAITGEGASNRATVADEGIGRTDAGIG